MDTDTLHTDRRFCDLYDRYLPRVYNYIRYRCDDDTTAEDLTAQVFERLLGSLDEVSHRPVPVEGWVFTVARNLVTSHYRRERLRGWLPWEAFLRRPARDPLPEEQALGSESRGQLSAALQQLSDRERDLLGLKFSASLNNREIANLTGLSENNVGVILHRALRRLRQALLSAGWPVEEAPCREREGDHGF